MIRQAPRRIVFFNRSYYPDFGATGQLLTELCEDLTARFDFDVTVVAGMPLAAEQPVDPVAWYRPVRREERNADAARELAHSFFESVLSGGLGTPEPGRGRFRSYLLGALKHFLSKRRATAQTGKRGGGAEHVPIVSETDTAPGLPLPGKADDELGFDREWALALLARALNSLEQEHAHKPELFAALKPWLDGGATTSQAEIAHALQMPETTVKVSIHRMRTRFRELIRAEIAATVNDPADVADELRHLIAVAASE